MTLTFIMAATARDDTARIIFTILAILYKRSRPPHLSFLAKRDNRPQFGSGPTFNPP